MSDYIFHVDVTCESCGRVGRVTDQALIQNRLLNAGVTKTFRCIECGAVGAMRCRIDYRESVEADFQDG